MAVGVAGGRRVGPNRGAGEAGSRGAAKEVGKLAGAQGPPRAEARPEGQKACPEDAVWAAPVEGSPGCANHRGRTSFLFCFIAREAWLTN